MRFRGPDAENRTAGWNQQPNDIGDRVKQRNRAPLELLTSVVNTSPITSHRVQLGLRRLNRCVSVCMNRFGRQRRQWLLAAGDWRDEKKKLQRLHQLRRTGAATTGYQHWTEFNSIDRHDPTLS